MRENSKIEYYFDSSQLGAVISLHSIYCDCERCRPIHTVCDDCGKTKKEHYHGVTGIYCVGFYDNTKKYMPRERREP